MRTLTPKQREIREREQLILQAARAIFFEEGYYGLTMAKIAERVECAKGTIYLHFPSKEDLVLTLALKCHERRQEMFGRAVRFRGKSRERMVAVGQAAELYARLFPGDMHLWHTITQSLRERASSERREAFQRVERSAVEFLVGVFEEGIRCGDLVCPPNTTVGEMAFSLWSLADGGYRIILSAVSLDDMGIERPFVSLTKSLSLMADAYGWRPLTSEWNYEETLQRVRREVFPEETQRLYEMGG